MRQRVVVTGLGAVTPLGNTKEVFWENLLSGVSGIRRVAFPGVNMNQYRTRIAAPVQGFHPSDYLPANKKHKYFINGGCICHIGKSWNPSFQLKSIRINPSDGI